MHTGIQTFWVITILAVSCQPQEQSNSPPDNFLFPPELVEWRLAHPVPLFEGTSSDTWDTWIRERGWILKEGDTYKMWYSGHDGSVGRTIYLGYATSLDGLTWTRHPDNPVFDEYWTEDMHVTKIDGTYYMVAEGVNDVAHMLTSTDGIHWERKGDLDIRRKNGQPLDPGPYGTPTLYIEDNTWYLFYERNDSAIWLATSNDQLTWTNVQDEPVIDRGPEKYDLHGVAVNQIVKYNGLYYAFYHGTPDPDWTSWNSNIAVSEDLVQWTKYEKNPIVDTDSISDNYSSPILVHDGQKYRLYIMHERVRVYFPEGKTN